ncbi:putative calcium-binding protein CML19 [Senna tora]|uniref:Putative calcium-binding protein CML19 n=1 Tax=Senna tora TaxID=362788 RepID=A0A835C939_9FABA|nr:putative calcium-binding protein CML19 [Senna tora]
MKANSSNCIRWGGWDPPNHDRVKCNVDGSYFDSTRTTACGGVARDVSSNFLFSFCHHIGCCEIIWAELRGIVDGLEMLWDKGFRKVLIECDSEVALELVSIGVDNNRPCSALVQRIRSLLDRNWDTELVHVFRETNQVADFMAKLSHTLSEGINVFDFLHVDLGPIFAADLNSPLVPRLCISPSELQRRLAKMAAGGGEVLTKEGAEMAIEALDSDGDGLVSLEDLMGLVEGGDEEEKLKDLREAFKMYDEEGCGFITPLNLKRMLCKLGESKTIDECKFMITAFDLNGDGMLNFEEFLIMMH